MEMKLAFSLAIVTALLMHHHSLAAATIAHHTTTPAANASLSGFSLQLVDADHEGLDHAIVRRGSDGFLYLQSLRTDPASGGANSSAANAIALRPEMTYTPLRLPKAVVVGVGTGSGHQDYPFLVVDTPSTLIWMQCKGCDPYSLQLHPLFDSRASPTYRLVAGTDPFCQPPYRSELSGHACAFSVTGPRGMSVEGYFGADTLTYDGKVHEHVPFGCAHKARNFQNDGKFAGVIGAAAVGRGLGLTTFSYCLFHGGGDGETSRRRGFLRFGTDVPRNPRYRTTRILPPPLALEGHESSGHYVSLVGVSLGARRLDGIRPEMFARHEDGGGGCVVDLGTPVTVMAREAYGVVEEAVWSELRRHGAERPGYGGLCVRASEAVRGRLQSLSLSLHFEEEEAVLVVSPEQLFLMVDENEQGRVACLAVKPGSRTVIGALQQVDTRFVFDLKDSKLSFASESCIQDTVEVV